MPLNQKKRILGSRDILEGFKNLDNDFQACVSRRDQNIDDYVNQYNPDGSFKDDNDAKSRQAMINICNEINNKISEIMYLDNYAITNNVYNSFITLEKVDISTIITQIAGNYMSAPYLYDTLLVFRLLAPYTAVRNNKLHRNQAGLFDNNEITVTSTIKEWDDETQKIIDTGELYSSDPVIPPLDVPVTFVTKDDKEEFAISVDPSTDKKTYVHNNIKKITDAIKDLFETYTDNGTQLKSIGLPKNNLPFITITTDEKKRTNFSSSVVMNTKISTSNNSFYSDTQIKDNYIFDNKYYICGTVDQNNDLVTWQVCKIYTQNEYSYISNTNGTVNTYMWSYSIERCRSITDGPYGKEPYEIYPYVYFNGSNLPKIFNELKEQYVICVEAILEGFGEEIEEYIDDDPLLDVSVRAVYNNILKWKNKTINNIDDIIWLYETTQYLWNERLPERIDILLNELNVKTDLRKELHNIIYYRINKDDGPFWMWYKDVLTTDMLYNRYKSKNEVMKPQLQRLSVWRLVKNTDGGYYIYIEKDISKYYLNVALNPSLQIDDIIYIVDDTNLEQKLTIRSITATTINVYGNEDGTVSIDINGNVQTRKVPAFCLEVDKIVGGGPGLNPIVYDKDDNGRIYRDETKDEQD